MCLHYYIVFNVSSDGLKADGTKKSVRFGVVDEAQEEKQVRILV